MSYRDVTYPVHRYSGPTTDDSIDAEVFGSGFILLKHVRYEDGRFVRSSTILIDPSDIENLEIAIKEARRRRNASARRRRRKAERERYARAG